MTHEWHGSFQRQMVKLNVHTAHASQGNQLSLGGTIAMSRPSVQWSHAPIVGMKEKKRERCWPATMNYAPLSGFIFNVLASPENLEEDAFVAKSVKLLITIQASEL